MNLGLDQSTRLKYCAHLICLLLIIYNIYTYLNNYNYSITKTKNMGDINFGSIYASEIFDYSALDDYLKLNDIRNKCFFMGTRNSILSNIFAGYKVKDIREFIQLKEKVQEPPSGYRAADIHEVKQVVFVAMEYSDVYYYNGDARWTSSGRIDAKKYLKDFRNLGWSITTTFVSDKNKSKIILLKRP